MVVMPRQVVMDASVDGGRMMVDTMEGKIAMIRQQQQNVHEAASDKMM